MFWFSLVLIAANLQLAVSTNPYEIKTLPSDSWFWRRAYHASVSLGNYIIIEGGEQDLNPYNNGTILSGLPLDFQADPGEQCEVELTILIDMSKSWTNASVPYSTAESHGAILNNERLWPASDNKTCYTFGGSTTSIWNAWLSPPVGMYQFVLNGSGNGSWSEFNSASSVWSSLTRPDLAAGASLKGTGYIMGGVENSHSSRDTMNLGDTVIPIPGIASYNTTSGQWSNDTAPSNVSNVFLEAVTNFGPAGLLIGAGHADYSTTAPTTISNLTIYEPIGKTWHNQSTTGNAPSIRDWACTVGLPGDNGSYEIFLYAGKSAFLGGGNLTEEQVTDNNDLDEVWVLSLPAFVWFKADYAPTQTRWKHTCNIVGNRQLLSIGGRDPNDANLGSISPDPIAQGLQIFDLTDMKWTSGYDAGATPYQSPQVVKDWYNANSGSTKFSDPAVQSFFKAAKAPSTSSTSPTPGPNPPPSSSSHTGAIAGGVVGSTAALATIALIVWSLLRRRRQTRPNYAPPGPHHQHSPWDHYSGNSSSPLPGELEDKPKRHELHGRRDGHEAPEMEARVAHGGPFEMGEREREKMRDDETGIE